MARTRGLLTDRDRELLQTRRDERENRHYQSISEVRSRIQDELPKDVEILHDFEKDLYDELLEAVGPVYYCPICGEGYRRVIEAVMHITGAESEPDHPMDQEEFEEWIPEWWPYPPE